MSKRFTDYREAHIYAVNLARTLGREIGIEKAKEFGQLGFNVHHLPKVQNRYGFELGREVVRPNESKL